jgi:polar amino acid transport system permease protein
LQIQIYSALQFGDFYFLFDAIGRTILLAVTSGIIGIAIGVTVGWARWSSPAASWLLAPVVDVIRSVPLIIQFILVSSFLAMSGHQANTFWLCVGTLSAYAGVLNSEHVRAGLDAVPRQYQRAARSLGFGYWQEIWHISGPIALRTVFPGLVGVGIALVKDTALVSVAGYVDFLKAAQILIARTNQGITILMLVGVVYFIISYALSHAGRYLERRMSS